MQNLTPELADKYGYTMMESVIVTGVAKNGPAAAAGLKEGDLVLAVNQQRTKSVEQFNEMVSNAAGSLVLQVRNKSGTWFYTVKPQ